MSGVTPEKVREWLADAGVWTGEPFDASVTGWGIARAYLEAVERAERAEAKVADAWDECAAWFALRGPLNGAQRISMSVLLEAEEANPYRAPVEPATVNPCQDVK